MLVRNWQVMANQNPFDRGRIPLDLLPRAGSSLFTMHALNSFNPLSIGPKCGCIKLSDRRCSRLFKWMRESGACVEPHYYSNIVDSADETEQQQLEDLNKPDVPAAANARAWGAIKLDISRTYPSMQFFRNEGQQQLFRVLRAYAFYDPEVGYVQGMNFLVACLLWHGTEEQAFWTLVAMMERYDMRSMFLPGLPGLQKRSGVVEQLIAQHFPDLMQHLLDVGISSQLVSTDWLLTLFSYSVPLEPLAELWDLFFEEGWATIYRIILIRIKALEARLMATDDLAELMAILKFASPPPPPPSVSKSMIGLASKVFTKLDSIPAVKIAKNMISNVKSNSPGNRNALPDNLNIPVSNVVSQTASNTTASNTVSNTHSNATGQAPGSASVGDNVNIAERGRILQDEEFSRATSAWQELVQQCKKQSKLVDSVLVKDLEGVYGELVKEQETRAKRLAEDNGDWELLDKM